MQTYAIQIQSIIQSFLQVFDDDICHLKTCLEQLKDMRAAVIKRDENALREIIDSIRLEQESYELVEERRMGLREELSGILSVDKQKINISLLMEYVTDESKEQLGHVQQQLKGLVEKLNYEYMSTSMLLKECVRLNGMLLKTIFGKQKGSMTYDARGASQWEAQNGIVSFKV